jgi:hypothetical protein
MLRGTRGARAVALAAALLMLAACGGAAEETTEGAVEDAIESELGGDATVDVEDDSLTIDTEDGSISAGTGELPEGFPDAVPLVDGEVVFGQRADSPEASGFTVQLLVAGTPEDVTAELTQALGEAGFEVQAVPSEGGSTLLADSPDWSVMVVVAPGDGGTNVLYTVTAAAAP